MLSTGQLQSASAWPTFGIYCGKSTGHNFLTATQWTSGFGASWSSREQDWGTIQYADLNGCRKADVCGRAANGISCAISNGSSFGPVSVWSSDFSDAFGWQSEASYWNTIRFIDVNGDGKADVCGRGTTGVYCAVSNGSSFGPARLWSSQYSNANNWHSDPSYWSTIMFADLNGDGKADICGRGGAGMVCAVSNGSQFVNVAVWAGSFNDAAGWGAAEYYSTIRLADINGDGRADVCGRGGAGFYCGLSMGGLFSMGPGVAASAFSDANGWSRPEFYQSLWVADVNADGKADICGRGYDGISCQLSNSGPLQISFNPVLLWINNFGDNYGWGSSEAYWLAHGPIRPIL